MENKCLICLKNRQNLHQISETCADNETWFFKLGMIIPEVVWQEEYTICDICTGQLVEIIKFRKVCIDLDEERQKYCKSLSKTSLIHSALETNYICEYCQQNFTEKSNLIEHLELKHIKTETNSNKKEYQCEKCKKVYTTERVRLKHQQTCDGIKRHTKLGEFQCEKCQNFYNTLKIKKAHYKLCTGNITPQYIQKFSCEICGAKFKYAKLVVEHCVEKHGMDMKSVKPYRCNLCANRFKCSGNLIQHQKYHDGNRSLVCSFCGKGFITRADLTSHEYIHRNKRNYKCSVCEKTFNTNKNLWVHNLVVHTDPSVWKYQCEVCEKKFAMKSNFEMHLRRHSGDKRFACDKCQKSFVSTTELRRHVILHTSPPETFECEHCKKIYKHERSLNVHLTRTHKIGNAKIPIRNKKFGCQLCPAAFYDKLKLVRHMSTHTGLKPYSCSLCHRNFTDKYNLKTHCRIQHKDTTKEKIGEVAVVVEEEQKENQFEC